uniref:Gastrin/cholecystokinin type B receptor n=1 Tax=Strigamia maritima TaxID=126957 RepID=T1IJT3_STRMM
MGTNSTFDYPNLTYHNMTSPNPQSVRLGAKVLIPLYSIIFVLSVLGNVLVIVTLVQNRRMRTVTNAFLLNLAVSDLFLAIFCIPVTLVGSLLRQFIFGEVMCKIIPYLQATTVSVSAWTLVAISIERFFAICQPLRSRKWQTLSHAYKMIAVIWVASITSMTPIVVWSSLIPLLEKGKFKCREAWPSVHSEKIFTIFLDVYLFLIPLVVMTATYTLVSIRLCEGIQLELQNQKQGYLSHMSTEDKILLNYKYNAQQLQSTTTNNCNLHAKAHRCIPLTKKEFNSIVRVNSSGRSLAAKQRVIKMLFVMVLEFFICWTPLHLINTLVQFYPQVIYQAMGNIGIPIIQLLAYISACCNPVTYCFMHCMFRNAFISAFSCRRKKWVYGKASDGSDTSLYISPQNTIKQGKISHDCLLFS